MSVALALVRREDWLDNFESDDLKRGLRLLEESRAQTVERRAVVKSVLSEARAAIDDLNDQLIQIDCEALAINCELARREVVTRRGMGSYDDEDDSDTRSKARAVEVALFVHKVLAKSLLCSEHGRQEYLNGELVKGKVIPWSLITWPDDRQLHAFRSFELIQKPDPAVFTFAVPEWFAHKNGLI